MPPAAEDVICSAVADGKLAWCLTEPEELKALLGEPTQQSTDRDGGMEVLTLRYPAIVAVFGKMHGHVVKTHGCRFEIEVQGRTVSVLSVYHPWFTRVRDELFEETLSILREYRTRWMT